MSKEIKQKADEVTRFFRDKTDVIFPNRRCTRNAIRHQKRLIEMLDKHRRLDKSISIKLEIEEQKAILTELQYRL